jgi:HD superfamily phosphohydrolase
VVNERIETIRRSSRQGLIVARRLAHGESPYAGEKVPNSVTRALKSLERLGLVHQPAPREWALTDPFLVDALREFNPHGVAAEATTALRAGPMNMPPSQRGFRYLRGEQAWGLRLQWFEPATTFRDTVHGDITLTRLERAIVQTSAFQRLRRTRQLGITYLVYPSATHTRFEHALGVLATSSSLCETVLYGRGSVRMPVGGHADTRGREVMALTRIAGLIHDLASLPYRDAIDDEKGLPLDSMGERLARAWELVVAELEEAAGLSEPEARSLLGERFLLNLHHACDERFAEDQVEYGFVRDLLNGPLSADSFDSTARDRTALGFGPPSFSRLASAMRLVNAAQRPADSTKHVALSLLRDPSVRDQMLHHLELACRHQESVSEHPRTRAATAMVGSAIARWLTLSADSEGESPLTLEQRLLGHSDDGLLDYLAGYVAFGQRNASADHEREAMAIGHLVDGILNRRLYDRIAIAQGSPSVSAELRTAFGDSRLRQRLETEAAGVAGIEGSGRLLVRIPEQHQLMLGEILIDDGHRVLRATDRDDATARAIRRLDQRLIDKWAIEVFVDPRVPAGQRRDALDWLASHLRVRWETSGDEVGLYSSSESEPAT